MYGRHLPRREPPKKAAPQVTGPHVVLETAVTGREVVHPRLGKAFLIATDMDSEDQVPEISRELRERFADKTSALLQRVAAQAGAAEFAPADVVFMDLETTGLSSSPLFLVGAMVWERNGLEVRQFLARNYAEEAAAIGCFLDECARHRFLVTFNGKSFDLPYLRMRAAANGIPFEMEPFHFDLLHECRRIWKGVLPNCSLQTLERHVCGRGRSGDIPGMEIPDAYHAFVRTGNAWQMVDILRHNLLDLVTLADLMTRLPAPSE
ncbi:MAG: hypothetical protein A3K19_11725 [Lentisphaerae bacterium RIFOXYB12_FULL_65_16]|nr:MAG: hypothetical protein A3K18_23195 [Lentisphaerae bacterium RIFOXYA12_64_32]OGV87982.1 MAG: hypothetical protein A3K19_11725 [Lentisphaerae bacterium RIFOXYB12_FULL_65_16]